MIGSFLSGDAAEFRHMHYETTGSTNTCLIEALRQSDPGNLWVTADEQTEGKGSRGRQWVSKPGNLYASLLLIDPAPLSHMSGLTFVAALAAHQAISEFINPNEHSLQLKWPNDVLLNGKKVSGILLESGTHKSINYCIVGMGMNCATFPDQTTHPSSCLKQEGIEVTPAMLFLELANQFSLILQIWGQGRNFSEILERWQRQVYGIGERVAVTLQNGTSYEGRFIAVNEQGYMLLETDEGQVMTISVADIFFNPTT